MMKQGNRNYKNVNRKKLLKIRKLLKYDKNTSKYFFFSKWLCETVLVNDTIYFQTKENPGNITNICWKV